MDLLLFLQVFLASATVVMLLRCYFSFTRPYVAKTVEPERAPVIVSFTSKNCLHETVLSCGCSASWDERYSDISIISCYNHTNSDVAARVLIKDREEWLNKEAERLVEDFNSLPLDKKLESLYRMHLGIPHGRQ